MNVDPQTIRVTRDLPALWRTRAVELRRYGAEAQAKTAECLADELDATLRQRDDEILTLTAAAQETSYNAEHLGRLIRQGKIPNAGRPNAPRVRRRDLPMKVGALPAARSPQHIGRAEVARAVINRQAGGAR